MTGKSAPAVPVSWGELLDKLTILEIKCFRIDRPTARANVEREHEALVGIAAPALLDPVVVQLVAALRNVNDDLWKIEDAIRIKDAENNFGQDFVDLARSVYRVNDLRAAIKRQINEQLASGLVEEKSYVIAFSRTATPEMRAGCGSSAILLPTASSAGPTTTPV